MRDEDEEEYEEEQRKFEKLLTAVSYGCRPAVYWWVGIFKVSVSWKGERGSDIRL